MIQSTREHRRRIGGWSLQVLRPSLALSVLVALAIAPAGCSKESDCSISSTCSGTNGSSGGDADSGPGAGTSLDGGGVVDGSPSPPISVAFEDEPPFELQQGKTLDLTIRVDRDSDFSEDVTISVDGLPTGVVAQPLHVPAGQTRGTLTLVAGSAVSQGLRKLSVRGTNLGGTIRSSPIEFGLLVRGAPGTLDETFGKKGIVELAATEGAELGALAVQADGKIVFVANGGGSPNIVVGRLDRDGVPDKLFGAQGIVRTSLGAGTDWAARVFVKPNGNIVVVGSAMSEAKLGALGLQPSGALDTSFGTGGRVLFGANSVTPRAALADDGAIFVLASEPVSSGVAIGRLTPAGQIDSTFGASGWYAIAPTAYPASARGLSSWGLIVGPSTVVASFVVLRGGTSAQYRVGLARIPRSGAGPAVFGETTVSNIVQYQVPVVRRSDGSAAVAFVAIHPAADDQLVLSQFSPDGQSIDPNFGLGGVATMSGGESAYDMVEDNLNRLVLARETCAIARRVKSGAPDASFGSGGSVVLSIGDQCVGPRILLQKDRRILVAATRTTTGSTAVALARLWH